MTHSHSLHSPSPLDNLHRRLREAYDELWHSFVDPREPLFDDGQRWMPMTVGSAANSITAGTLDEIQLSEIRRECRLLALENEFAINGHENRISYIIGSGHSYRATVCKGCEHSSENPLWEANPFADAPQSPLHSAKGFASQKHLALQVQRVIDEFIKLNSWHHRQQEIVRRRDRDGEVFLRFFVASDGTTRVRFVEPDQIVTPPEHAFNPAARLGILTERDDVEAAIGYFIDGQFVEAREIQHRKANVDVNVRRGLPLFYPVRKNLRRAEKLLRNMSVVAEIQSAIALIRKHRQGTAAGVKQFVADQADAVVVSPTTGNIQTLRRYGPGTILDAHAGIDYDFPAAGVEASNFVTVLQAELRAVASRLVMPEFMLTSDASNANYSSTMIAEGPAMRMFARLQTDQVRDDLAVMRRVVDDAIVAGRLPAAAREVIEIQAVPPSLAVRDQLKETQRHRIEHESGILSAQTWSQLAGLDYDQEQANFAAHLAAGKVG